jgi:hypothetical protein
MLRYPIDGGLSCAEQKRESNFCLLTNPVRASALRCVLYKEALENIFATGVDLLPPLASDLLPLSSSGGDARFNLFADYVGMHRFVDEESKQSDPRGAMQRIKALQEHEDERIRTQSSRLLQFFSASTLAQ